MQDVVVIDVYGFRAGEVLILQSRRRSFLIASIICALLSTTFASLAMGNHWSGEYKGLDDKEIQTDLWIIFSLVSLGFTLAAIH